MPRLIVLALLTLAMPAAAAEKLVEKELLCAVSAVEQKNGATELVVARGKMHGVVVGARGDVWQAGATSGIGDSIARVEVISVDEKTSRMRVVPDPASHPELITAGAQVEVRALFPSNVYAGILFELALDNIFFLDNYKQPIAGADDIFTATDDGVEKKVLAQMIECGHEVIEFTLEMKEQVHHGPHDGLLLKDVLAKADVEDYRRFLRFVRDFPGKYIGTPWKISETFATWVINDEPYAAQDLLEEMLAAPPSKQVAVQKGVRSLRSVFDLVAGELDALPKSQEPAAQKRIAQLESLLAMRKRVKDVKPAELLELRAVIDQVRANRWRQGAKTRVMAAKAYERAADEMWKAELRMDSIVALDNAALSYLDAEKTDDVLLLVERIKVDVDEALAKETSPMMRAALPLRAAFANRMKATVDAQRGNYQAVVDELVPMIDVYEKGGFRGARADLTDLLTRLATAYGHLGKVDEAKNAYERMEKLATELDDRQKQAQIALDVADWHARDKRTADAVAGYTRAADLAEKAGDTEMAARAKGDAAAQLWSTGKQKEALALHDEIVKMRTALDDQAGAALEKKTMASLQVEMGDRAAAEKSFQEVLAIWQALDNKANQADVQVELGKLYMALSKFDKADEAYAAAEKIHHGLKRSIDEANAIQGRAQAALRAHDTKRGVELVDKSISILEGTKTTDVAWALLWKGRIIDDQGQHKEARDVYARALRTSGGDASLAHEVHTSLGYMALNAGDLAAATKEIELSKSFAEKTGIVSSKMDVLRMKSQLFGMQGRFDEARKASEELIALARESGNRPVLTDALRALSWTNVSLGKLEEGKKLAEEALPLADQNDDPVEKAWVMNTLANVHEAYGEVDAAIKLYDEAITILHAEQQPFGEAAMIFNRSLRKIDLRDLDAALADLTRAEELAGSRIDIELKLGIGGARGQIYTLRKRYPEAEKALLGVIALARTSQPEWLPGFLVQLGRVQAEKGDVAAATKTLDEAVKIEDGRAGDHYGARGTLGVVLMRARQDDKALPLLLDVEQRAAKRGGLQPWEEMYALGVVEDRAGHVKDARRALEKSIGAIESGGVVLKDDVARARYREDKADAYRLLVKVLLSDGEIDGALQVLEKGKVSEIVDVEGGKGDALGAELSAQEQKLSSMLDEERRKEKPDADRIARLDELWQEAQKKKAAFIEDLDRKDELFDRYSIRPLQLEKLQQQLEDGVLVVSPVVLGDRVVVFAVTKKEITHFDAVIADAELQKLVSAFLDETKLDSATRGYRAKGPALTTSTQASLDRAKVPARKLYDVLLRKAFEKLGTPKTLVVSAAGALRYVPFGALLDGDTWVIEKTDVVEMTALSAHIAVKSTGKQTVLALADPDGSLPGARDEVQGLSQALAGTVVLDGKDATAATLRERVKSPGFDIVHLATHGRLDAENPQKSNILFADRSITYADIPTLPFSKTHLVVLSACDTAAGVGKSASAAGNSGTGVEIAGLAYQFQRTKVDAVLATLWPVEDTATASLMKQFYAGIAAGKSYGKALADAQRAELKKHPHPAYWAPFVLMGSP